MSRSSMMLVALGVMLLLLASPGEALYGTRSAVKTLDDSSFDSVTSSDSVWFVEFFAPWCGHCKNLTPEWEKAAKALKGVVNVAAVDATEDKNRNLASKYGVSGFPTIKVFGEDKRKPTDYQGGRTASAIVDSALKEVSSLAQRRLGGGSRSSKSSSSGPSSGGSGSNSDVVSLDDSNFASMVMESEEQWIVGFFAPWCGHCKALLPDWDKAATELKGMVNVGSVDATVSTSLAQSYQVQGYPTLKLFPAGQPKRAEAYEGPRTADGIVSYALEKLEQSGWVPAAAQLLSQSDLDIKCGSGKICGLAFLPHIMDSGKAGREDYLNTLVDLMRKSRGTPASFFWVEAGAQPDMEARMGLEFGFPAFVAISFTKGRYAVLKGSFSANSMSSFMVGLTTGAQKTSKVDMPVVVTTSPWDGEDAIVEEEEWSLDDIMGDD